MEPRGWLETLATLVPVLLLALTAATMTLVDPAHSSAPRLSRVGPDGASPASDPERSPDRALGMLSEVGAPRAPDAPPPPPPATAPASTRPSDDGTAETPAVLSYCVIQITTPDGRAARRAAAFDPASKPGASHHVHVNARGTAADVVYQALTRGMRDGGGCAPDASWYFVGDDDTLFSHAGILAFAAARRKQVEQLVAHGNSYRPSSPNKAWFTGGSGMALTKAAAKALGALEGEKLRRYADVLDAEHAWCGCFDVPFARGLSHVGARLFHLPNQFLDSCLDCDRRMVEDVPVVGCHAATMFRKENTHSKSKGGDAYAELPRGMKYDRPERFERMNQRERREHFDEKCDTG
jgi:hypothetical protein